ncbi:kinase-like domain-containing protein, partial [Dichotomocladium elegans]
YEAKVRELQDRINKNKTVREAAIRMRSAHKDPILIAQIDTQIREAEKYTEYFSEELHKLQTRRSASTSSHSAEQSGNLPFIDLLTTAIPFNKPKVSLKLHELEYKLDVENKMLAGIKTMADVLGRDPSAGDRRQRDEVQGQLNESLEKRDLLNRALRKYKGLYIGEGDEDEYELETPPSARVPPGFRRPVTGKLQLLISEARDLTHAPSRIIKMPETVLYIKIDGNVIYKTRPSRNDKWLEECEIHVAKASEVEIVIYDESPERKVPIGILWLKISDIADGLRKRKVQQEGGQGWVSAEIAQQRSQDTLHGDSHSPVSRQPVPVQQTQDGIQAWFDVEPIGALALRLNFVRETGNRRPMDKLGRVGAVRQRVGEVHEMNGHQFVEKKFYNVMKCALCGEFLVNSGYQCEDCEYTCHKKCYGRVVTKCVSKPLSDAASDRDEEKLNHRIPHRFEPITNIGANWCCHCGYMLPLGSRGAKKCSECDITCHTKCAHLVPDFCGLSMEMANQMLAEIKAAKRKTLDTGSNGGSSSPIPKPQQATPRPDDQIPMMNRPLPPQQPHPPSPHHPQQQLPPSMSPGRMNMGQPPLPPHMGNQPQYMPYPPDPRFQHQQQQQPLPYPPPGMRPVMPPPHQSPYAPIPNQPPMARPPPPQPPQSFVKSVGLDDFNFLAVLGKGNFGKVMLAEEKHDHNLYAIKVLKKRFIMDNDEIESLRSEKRIFQAANRERHPFLIGLHSCFQTESRVYFVMEYVSGGDLMWHIQREPFSERRAKFYACEVLLALEYFHSQGIIYRDLKLDNIMLGLDGHIKVADYGLCKENMWYGNTTGTFCGTPEFMAPEILREQKYGRAVDWWAFGVLIYEMLLGQSPFRGEDEDEIFDAILEDEILYPINMSRDSVSICQKLLLRDPARRLGASKTDALEIKQHPFFRGVNWEDMLAKRVPPPFYPTITGRLDTSNFDEEFTRERPALTPIQSNLTRAEQQEFDNFPYVANWATSGNRQPTW